MLIVVRRDDHQLAVINTDQLIQVLWQEEDGDYDRWSVQMTHGRKIRILTAKTTIAIPTTAAGATITPDKLITTLAGGLSA